jgi:hypothetical protein
MAADRTGLATQPGQLRRCAEDAAAIGRSHRRREETCRPPPSARSRT